MGCCGKSNNKIKSKNDVTKTEKKKNKEKKRISNPHIPQKISNQNQLLKTESNIQQESISSPDYDIDNFISKISSTDNISPIKTSNDLQTFVEKNKKSVSIVLFYGRYCPYSKRTIPDLRQWAQANKDRIFLYEADVEQASKLAEYYHIRTIPTIMAFDQNNLLAPIWQRTANNVLSSSSINDSKIIEKIDNSNDRSLEKSNSIEESITSSEKIDNSNDRLLEKSNSIEKSIALSEQSPYIWDRSIQSVDNGSQSSSKELTIEYNGRMISQSTISNDDRLKKKRTWSDYLDDNRQINEYQQHIHLPNSNEIFYEKQFNNSLSSDRFSTLTYEHVKYLNNQQEEICILYLGPNRNRGFEDNLSDKTRNSSKYSLLTLKSHLLSE